MQKTTPLLQKHQEAQAKMVDFAGWLMPLHYGSQLEEHRKVRQDAGVFDVSHMAIVDIKGEDATNYLRYLLANDVAKLKAPGKALYSCMLNEAGGVIDDLIVYKLSDHTYRLVLNASTREKDLAWLKEKKNSFAIRLLERNDLAMIAVQGPQAIQKTLLALSQDKYSAIKTLLPFHFLEYEDWLFARTGYTGEDGLEIQLPGDKVAEFWQALLNQGIAPCGLGSRDTLRLEAGLNLYGVDMDESTSPLESNLAWTVAFEPKDRYFIGREALEKQKQLGIDRQLVGLVLESAQGILRNHQKVMVSSQAVGEITSGSFSPTLGYAIALARISNTIEDACEVEIRHKKLVAVRKVAPPFVRKGQKVYK